MVEKINGFDQFEIDQLKEITNIGAGNAATALSHMLGKKVNMSVPELYMGGVDSVQREIGQSEDQAAATFFKFYGDIDGALVMIFPPQSAVDFVNLLTKKEYNEVKEISEDDLSALKEMGNILLGSSITALNKFLNLNIMHTIPDLAVDMLGAIMDSVLVEVTEGAEALVFKVKLNLIDEDVEGDMFYFLDPKASKKLIKRMKGK